MRQQKDSEHKKMSGLKGEIQKLQAELNQLYAEHSRMKEFVGVRESGRDPVTYRGDEEQFRLLADNISQLTWVTNQQGEILWYNKSWYDYTGKSLEDMQSQGYATVLPPDFADSVLESFQHCLKNGEPWEASFPILGKNGEYRWFLGRAQPVSNQNGRINFWFGTNTDITEQRKTEENLRNSEQRLEAIFNNAAIGIVELDASAKFIFVNSQMCEMLGYSRGELLQKTVIDVTAPEDRTYSSGLYDQLRRGELSVLNYEKRYNKKDGAILWVQVSVSALREKNGEYLKAIGTVKEITESRKMLEELRISEERYRTVIEAADLGTWDFDIETGVAAHSWRHDQIFGYPEPQPEWSYEISVQHIFPEYHPVVREAVAKALETGVLAYDAKIRWPDGSIHWIAPRGRVSYSSDGNPLRMAGIVSDITERKEADEALRESEEKFRSLFENITEGVALYEILHETDNPVKYCIIDTNPAFREYATYYVKAEAGKSINEIFQQNMLPYFHEFAKVAETRNPFKFEAQFPNLNKYFVINVISPKKGQFATVLEDITEHKRIEAELKQRNEELTRFIYTVSHDLKSPLVTIKSFSSYLMEDIANNDTESLNRDVSYIQNSTDKMGKLLEELLELSRVGRKEKSQKNVSLREIVAAALDMVAGRIKDKNIQVKISGPEVMLFGHTQRLVQLYQNLIDNAAKFMSNQPDPLIEIGTFLNNEKQIVLFVRDNGSGIDPQYHHKLFGLFEKLDPDTEGTGIGLALVKRIVEVHDGSIWFTSEGAGKGSTFFFTLANSKLMIES